MTTHAFLQGDCLTILPTLATDSVQCVVTSPPYYSLRDYGTAQWEGGDALCDHLALASGPTHNLGNAHSIGKPYRNKCSKCGARRTKDHQIGLEDSSDQYITNMVSVFREVKRVLRPDGTVWLNVGDTFSTSNNLSKPKDLLMVPARLALALQNDGWYIRSDVIWHKTVAMPEGVKDRPTSAYEHVFMLTKSGQYYYNYNLGIEEGFIPSSHRIANLRNVWKIGSDKHQRSKEGSHAATMPVALAERCIKASSRNNDVVLDPFGGAGTTALAATNLGRSSISIELNPKYIEIAKARIAQPSGFFDSGITIE